MTIDSAIIDIVPAMLDREGEPRRDIFQCDGFHLNALGDRILSARVKSALVGRRVVHVFSR